MTEERRKEDPRVRQLSEDVGALKADVGGLKIDVGVLSSDVSANTLLTLEVKENTAGLVEIIKDSREAFRLFNKIMGLVRWFIRRALTPFVVVAALLYAITHDMRPPEWLQSWVDLVRK